MTFQILKNTRKFGWQLKGRYRPLSVLASSKLFLLLHRSFPLVIVHTSVMTMTPTAKTLSSALFTPGLLGGERGNEEKLRTRAVMGGKYVEGNEKRKVQDKKETSVAFFFSCALFTSRMGEVKRAAREGESDLRWENMNIWREKYERRRGQERSKVREKREQGEGSVWEKRMKVMGGF